MVSNLACCLQTKTSFKYSIKLGSNGCSYHIWNSTQSKLASLGWNMLFKFVYFDLEFGLIREACQEFTQKSSVETRLNQQWIPILNQYQD